MKIAIAALIATGGALALAAVPQTKDWCERSQSIYEEEKARPLYERLPSDQHFMLQYEQRCNR